MRRRAPILLVAVLGVVVACVWWALSRGAEVAAPIHVEEGRPAPVEVLAKVDAPDTRVPAAAPAREEAPEVPKPSPALSVRDELRFCARVVTREKQEPIAGARVHVETRAAPPRDGAPVDVTTDTEGRFELDLESQTAPYLSIRAPGFGPVFVAPQAGHATPETAMLVFVEPSASLTVRLLGVGDLPIAGARVLASTQYYHLLRPDGATLVAGIGIGDPAWSAETDAQGSCTLADLPPDAPIDLEATRDRRVLRKETAPLTLHVGETRTLEWRIGSGSRLSGRVTETSGAAVTGLSLWVLRATSDTPEFLNSYAEQKVVHRTTTRADGGYAIDDIASGKWWIGPAPSRTYLEAPKPEAIAPIGVLCEVPEGAADAHCDFVVHRGLYVRGRVLDPSGAPAPRVAVFGTGDGVTLHDSVVAGDDGTFAFGPLVPGRYHLSGMAGAPYADSDPVEASAGDEGVVLQLKSGGVLAGTVVDASSGVPCPASLTITGLETVEPLMMLGDAKSDGTFSFSALRPGNYDVAAQTDDARVGFIRSVVVGSAAPGHGPIVRVAAGARVSIRYDGKSSYGTFEVKSDGVIVGINSLQRGTSRVQAVPAGAVAVKFTTWDPTRSQTKELLIAVGETKEVAFSDPP